MLFQGGNINVDEILAADSTAKASAQATIDSVANAYRQGGFDDALKVVLDIVLQFGWTLLKAVVVFYIGRWIIRKLRKIMERIFERRNVDSSLRTFLGNLVGISLNIMLIIMIFSILGIHTTSFVALLASAGLAIGMALSGTLQNFAGGVMILLLKPYRVGDYIEAQGQGGTVKSIQLFNTIINTSDNKTIIIPNGGISTGIVNNYSKEPTRRVEWILTLEYGVDFDKARVVMQKIIDADTRILKNPSSLIALHALADSSVNMVVRGWVRSGDFWNVFFDINERVYKMFPTEGINFPYPQLDVRVLN